MDKGAWQAAVHGVTKALDTTEQLNNNNNLSIYLPTNLFIHLWFLLATVKKKNYHKFDDLT